MILLSVAPPPALLLAQLRLSQEEVISVSCNRCRAHGSLLSFTSSCLLFITPTPQCLFSATTLCATLRTMANARLIGTSRTADWLGMGAVLFPAIYFH